MDFGDPEDVEHDKSSIPFRAFYDEQKGFSGYFEEARNNKKLSVFNTMGTAVAETQVDLGATDASLPWLNLPPAATSLG